MNQRNPLPTATRMIQSVVAVLVIFITLSCQPYTTGLKKAETGADETTIISSLRTIALAQQSHAATNGGSYASFLQLTEGGYLDARFNSESPELHGYVLTMKLGDKTFSVNADPAGEQKGRHFYVDSSSQLIRANPTQPATAKDDVVQL